MGLKDLKNINYKQFAFDHGEKIGLSVAGFVALSLGIWLFVPGSGLFATSADTHAKELNGAAEKVNGYLTSNQPSAEDLPQGNVNDKLVAFAFDVFPDARIEQDYGISRLFDGRRGGPGGRLTPTILQPAESDVTMVRFQLPALVYSEDEGYLLTLVMGPSGNGASGAPNGGGTVGQGPMMTPPMPGGRGGFNSPFQRTKFGQTIKTHGIVQDRSHPDPNKAEHDYDLKWIKVDDIKDLNGAKLAMQTYPVRAAEIVASFPYKQEIEEFKTKLGKTSEAEVLTEPSEEPGVQGFSFRFKGMDVERRQVNAEGRPIDARGTPLPGGPDAGWAPVDVQDAYAPLIRLSGGVERLEPEKPRLQNVFFVGLTLPKLPTLGDLQTPPVDEYPDIEDQLPKLKETMDKLAATPTEKVAKPAFSQAPDNVFNLTPGAGLTPGGGAASGGTGGAPGATGAPMPAMPTGGISPGATGRPGGSTGPGGPGLDTTQPVGPANAKGSIPDYGLIRLFDFTVEPGKTYQYRLRVRMANPNIGHKDVASQGIASDPELTSQWHQLPKNFAVPPDLYFYAVDQKKLDDQDPKLKEKEKERAKDKDHEKEVKLPSYTQHVDTEQQTVLQIQKWVDFVKLSPSVSVPVGDWVIAERVVATRGAPVGPQRVEVVYWRRQQDRFQLAKDDLSLNNPSKLPASVTVPFAPEEREPILVDFRPGDTLYTRTHPKTDDAAVPAMEPAVSDKAPEEVLLFTADGKLLAHNAGADRIDPERKKRVEEERIRIDSVKYQKAGDTGTGGYFGKPSGPAQ